MPSKLNEEKDSYAGRRDQDIAPDASHLVVEGRDHTFTKYVGKFVPLHLN